MGQLLLSLTANGRSNAAGEKRVQHQKEKQAITFALTFNLIFLFLFFFFNNFYMYMKVVVYPFCTFIHILPLLSMSLCFACSLCVCVFACFCAFFIYLLCIDYILNSNSFPLKMHARTHTALSVQVLRVFFLFIFKFN